MAEERDALRRSFRAKKTRRGKETILMKTGSRVEWAKGKEVDGIKGRGNVHEYLR